MTPAEFNDKPTTVFQIGIEPSRIDILQGIAGVNFDEAWEKRVDGNLDENTSREHLIKNKIAVGRHQDLADVEKLRESGSQTERD